MDLFYKKKYEELQRIFDCSLENQKKQFKEQLERNELWIQDLLFKSSDLEKEIVKLKQELNVSKSNNAALKLELKVADDKVKQYSTRSIELGATVKSLRAGLGGSKKENNKLRDLLGTANFKIELMEEQLKKYRIKPVTMQELREYERTHKSPRTKNELQNT